MSNNEEEIVVIENENEEEIVTISEDTPSSDKNYVHTQSTASDTWNITHNLYKYPSVTVVDSANNEVIGDITYIDLNNIQIKFNGAFAGKAYIN